MNTCTYTAASAGKGFGESTTDEMCFASRYVVAGDHDDTRLALLHQLAAPPSYF